jgi:hypothetical protein
MLLMHGDSGTLAVVKAGAQRQFFVDTPEDERIENGLRCVLYMIREVNSPLIVLPKNHPASARLKIVVAAGKRIVLSCDITPGTHLEQHLLCGMKEFDGAEILGVEGGVELKGLEWTKYEKKHFFFFYKKENLC